MQKYKQRPIWLPDETTEELTWYIDGSTGSDESGNGTEENPFATFNVLERLPTKLKHDVKIRPAAGTYTSFPDISPEKLGGNLIIDASDQEPVEIEAGPFEIDSIAAVGEAVDTVNLGNTLTVTGTPGWTPGDYTNKFILMLSGDSSGIAYPIFDSGADSVTIGVAWTGISAGDTFKIVDTPVRIEVSSKISLKANFNRGNYDTNIIICGITFHCDDSESVAVDSDSMFFGNVAIAGNFCKISAAKNWEIARILNSEIGIMPIPTGSLAVSAMETFSGAGFIFCGNDEVPTDDDSNYVSIFNSIVAQVMCRGLIYNAGGFCEIYYSMLQSLWDSFAPCQLFCTWTLLNQPVVYGSAYINRGGYVTHEGVRIDGCTKCMLIEGQSTVNLKDVVGEATGTSAVTVAQGSTVTIDEDVSMDGSSYAFSFIESGTTVADWPDSYEIWEDTFGNRVQRGA